MSNEKSGPAVYGTVRIRQDVIDAVDAIALSLARRIHASPREAGVSRSVVIEKLVEAYQTLHQQRAPVVVSSFGGRVDQAVAALDVISRDMKIQHQVDPNAGLTPEQIRAYAECDEDRESRPVKAAKPTKAKARK